MLKPEIKIHIIDTPELFNKLEDYFNKHVSSDILILDTETNNKQERLAKLFGIALAYNDKRAFYIVWRDKTGKDIWSLSYQAKIAQWLIIICKNRKLIGHNLIYDILVLEYNLDIYLESYVSCDTLILKHTLNENKPHALKSVCKSEFGNWVTDFQDKVYNSIRQNGGKVTKKDIEFWKSDTAILAEYSCWDCILTLLLYNKYVPMLKAEGLEDFFFKNECMPLFFVTLDMRRQGFPINVPHFQQLKVELTSELTKLEEELMAEIEPQVHTYIQDLLVDEFPIKNTGNFPKALAKAVKIPLPLNSKTNKITVSAKELVKLASSYPQYATFYAWIRGLSDLPLSLNKYLSKTRQLLFKEKYPNKKHVFNLRSNQDLSYWIFDVLGCVAVEKTPKGARKLDDDLLESIKSDNPTFNKLITYKKLNKLLSTYVVGILDLQIDGKIYTSLHQTGTVSGRYASSHPNLQNLPRTKDEEEVINPIVLKYTNAIRQGFIAPPGFVLVDGDYDQLEARCFASISGEKNLQQVFLNGDDIYSKVAADIYKIDLTGVSLNKKSENYFGKLYPNERHNGKTITLAIPYGSETQRVSEILNCTRYEAKTIINSYLTSYPTLHKWMKTSEYRAKHDGFIKTQLGRIRHLKALEFMYILWGDQIRDYEWAAKNNLLKERRAYKVALNTSKNVQNQGLAASLINQAMIVMQRNFKKQGLDAHIILSVHDEVIIITKQEQAETVVKLIKDAAENTNKLEVPLVMTPKIAGNWKDAK